MIIRASGALFYWYFITLSFARALATFSRESWLYSSNQLYAGYRLGLYKTVASCPRKDNHWRGGFALSVSLAACGRQQEAENLVRELIASRHLGRHRSTLANALAPFAPQLALEILPKDGARLALRAALLQRCGHSEQAAELLSHAIRSGEAKKNPELELFSSNSETGAPLHKLARMNAFLAGYGLSPLALRDNLLPPGQMNLRATEPLTISKTTRGPLVSVLMTAFQSGQRIESAINSLLAQTYRDIEIIVVDDASSDDTGDIVRAIAARDPRVIYLCLPCNVGTYVAKSIGLRHTSGEFVTCHDSDDWSHPQRIEMQVRPLLENKRLVFTTSHWVRIQDDGIYYARPVHPLMRLNPASPLFRKQIVLEKAGGWDAVRTGADSEFIARLKLVFGRRAMRRIAQPLAFGAHRPDSLMTAASTGYCAAGMSPVRLAYWEGWGHWHIDELRAGRQPYIPPDMLAERRFVAPAEIVVPRQAIQHCLQNPEVHRSVHLPLNQSASPHSITAGEQER